MSSAGRAASSSGCVARPRRHETCLTGYAESIQHSSPTGSSVMETAEHREPYESRGSRTDLGAPGGESPPGDSTTAVHPYPVGNRQQWVESGHSSLMCLIVGYLYLHQLALLLNCSDLINASITSLKCLLLNSVGGSASRGSSNGSGFMNCRPRRLSAYRHSRSTHCD